MREVGEEVSCQGELAKVRDSSEGQSRSWDCVRGTENNSSRRKQTVSIIHAGSEHLVEAIEVHG